MRASEHCVLWTGGMDSTFLLLKLISEDVSVRPIHIALTPATIRDLAVQAAVREQLPKWAALPETEVIDGRNLYDQMRAVRLELAQIGCSIGHRESQIPYQSMAAAGLSRAINQMVYLGNCADDRCRQAEWLARNGVEMPLRYTHKTEMVSIATSGGWLNVLAATHSCIRRATMEHCGSCVECVKRKKSGVPTIYG